MLLQALAHHLGRKTRLHVAQALDFLVLVANELFSGLLGLSELELVRRRELLLARIAHRKFAGEFGTSLIALALGLGNCPRELGSCLALLLANLRTQRIGLTLGVGLGLLDGELACRIGSI